eukprot:m.185904 g.185904  ORF g.185904 m.185904 type:complete len:61 (+) comp16689_c1_seq2:352-534(+)
MPDPLLQNYMIGQVVCLDWFVDLVCLVGFGLLNKENKMVAAVTMKMKQIAVFDCFIFFML